MDQQKTGSQDGLLTKVYKNLFLNNTEKNSIESELKISKILDKESGIFGVSENKVFNFDAKSDIFSTSREKTIFDMKDELQLFKNSKSTSAPKNLKPEKDTSKGLDLDILRNLNLNKGEKSPELGNNFDQSC